MNTGSPAKIAREENKISNDLFTNLVVSSMPSFTVCDTELLEMVVSENRSGIIRPD
jgi:hypothetical protein